MYKLNQIINRKLKFDQALVDKKMETLRKEIIGSLWLALPDIDEHFTVESDAPDYCIGGVIRQVQKGKEAAIRF